MTLVPIPARTPPPKPTGLRRRVRAYLATAASWALTRGVAMQAQDAFANVRWNRHGGGEILLVRHPTFMPFFYNGFLHWLVRNFPDCRRHFRLAYLPCALPASPRPRLIVPWIQDPIESWSPEAYRQTVALTAAAAAAGIGVINRPEHLTNIKKSATAAILAPLGIRTPRTLRLSGRHALQQALDSFPRPFFIRNDESHSGRLRLIQAGDAIGFEELAEFATPVAIEFINTQSPDGLYRKFRYQAAGEFGVGVHQVTSRFWEVRDRMKQRDDAAYREEAAYLALPDPHHAILQRARAAMQLDFVAFDYAYDRDGRLTVWEANGYPSLFFSPPEPGLKFRDAPMHRIFAAMLGLYLDRAGLKVPEPVDLLRQYTPISARRIGDLDASIGIRQKLMPPYASPRGLFAPRF